MINYTPLYRTVKEKNIFIYKIINNFVTARYQS